MEDNIEAVNKIEDVREAIMDMWNDINIKDVEKINDNWTDEASTEYIKKINNRFDILEKYWVNYNKQIEEEQ